MKFKKILLSVLIALVALTAATLWFVRSFKPITRYYSVEEINRNASNPDLKDCFWFNYLSAPSVADYAYPDTGTTYWITQFKLPPDAKLELVGEYPHARYMSYNTYNEQGQAADRLIDFMIAPDPGAANPFKAGARRDAKDRSYRIRIEHGDVKPGADMAQRDAARPQNTLYVPKDADTSILIRRIYVPDSGLNAAAGVKLPHARMTLADGSTVQGENLCKSIVIKERSVRDTHLTLQAIRRLLSLESSISGVPPAHTTPKWMAFLNQKLAFSSLLEGTSFEWIQRLISHERTSGFFNTLDNNYMYAYVDNRLGDTLVIEGRPPSTPKTFIGNQVMQAGQLRYWSLCKYRSLYNTGVDTCVYDEQAPLNSKGEYTIVYSTEAMRPSNARLECGVVWRPWGIGDGVDNPHGGLIAMRNMSPAPDFKQTIATVVKNGTEKEVLGEYFPRPSYQSKAAFEARGCASPIVNAADIRR